MENKMYKIILILSISILITNHANAQQTINPNVKHDWEDSRYTVNANNTVTDNKTNLIWKRCPQGLSDSDCSTDTATVYNWQDALDLANDSTFAGFTDWRLPNIKELRSLAAYDRYNPAINSEIFPNTPSSWFWSSSPYANSPYYASRLNFGDGRDDFNYRDINYYVRLVRGGQ
jgi:hypothetical protein